MKCRVSPQQVPGGDMGSPPISNPSPPETSNIEHHLLEDHHNFEPFPQDSPNPGMDSLFRLPSFGKRKKGKPNLKKQQAIERKYHILKDKLRPIPFEPSKILCFANYEKLLRGLGLWDFVRVEFDGNIRSDLVAQLVASYDSKARSSYVNGVKIMVNRADLGRAFKLPPPVKKGVGEGVELDLDLLTQESIGFVVDFVSNWVLLHEDTWMMPVEVLNWMKVIRDGHPEKVDWASLLWFMVEKELTQGEQLVDCYYASHLQYLMKNQREELLLAGDPYKVELDGEDEEVVVGVDNEKRSQVDCTNKVQEVEAEVGVEFERVNLDVEQNQGVGEGSLDVDPITDAKKEAVDVPNQLNIELTLGEDIRAEEEIVEEEKVRDAERMDFEERNEHVGDDKTKKWQLNTENTVSEHTLQMSNMGLGNDLYNYESINEELEDIDGERGEEEEDTFGIMQNHDAFVGDGPTGNFLQAMQENKLAFSSPEQFHDRTDIGFVTSRNDMPHSDSAGPSFYGNGGKRPLEHMSGNTQNGINKRSKIDGSWINESPDFVMCMDGFQQLITRAKMMYQAKEQSLEQSNANQQILLDEVQKRDSLIEQLHKRCEQMQEKDEEIYRLERELYVMGNLLDGYREALKETQKAFGEYKQRVPQPEESIYKDAGPGGLMLTSEAIERRRLKREEDHRANCLILEQKTKEAEEGWTCMFAALLESVHKLDSRLVGLENEFLELKNLSRDLKATENEQPVSKETSVLEQPISKETSMLEEPAPSEIVMAENCEGTGNEEPAPSEIVMAENCEGTGNEEPAPSEIVMAENCEGTRNEEPAPSEIVMAENCEGTGNEEPAPSEIVMPENCEGTGNEKPISREAGMFEHPASSEADIPDNCEGTEYEQAVSRETSTPNNHQGMGTEQN